MNKLEKKLKCWQQNNLISAEQAQKIQQFESQNKNSHLFYALLSLGIFIIALGIISIIAANWNEISDLYKLGADIVILFGLSFAAYMAYSRNQKLIFEIEVFALFWLVGASIGLNAQIFQTSGSPDRGMLLWALFSAPLLWLSNKKLLPLFWVPAALFGLFGNLHFIDWIEDIFEWLQDTFGYTLTAAVIIFIFASLSATAKYIQKRLSQPFPTLSILGGYFEFFAYLSALMTLVADFSLKMMIISITTFALGCYYYFRCGSKKMMNFNVSMIGLCFFISYIALFSDLMTTGIGLIISGIIIILLLLGIKKAVKHLITLKEKIHA